MARVKIKLNSKGVRELLNRPEVQEDLRARAERIRAAAGPSEDFEILETTTDRPGVTVITASEAGRRAEAEDRSLTRAIDSGR